MQSKLEPGRDLRKHSVGTLAASQIARDNADVMTAIDLTVRDIEDVTNNTAHRRAYGMQDAKWRAGRLSHCQNQRSATTTVSPGFRSVPGGTTA